ncbi:hypothetical protein [Lysobacter gummosus]|uniref:hypothetical protein n=1 Tax=Lysobacter gummosus TaxID=262324 RepID=UPI00363AFB9F
MKHRAAAGPWPRPRIPRYGRNGPVDWPNRRCAPRPVRARFVQDLRRGAAAFERPRGRRAT